MTTPTVDAASPQPARFDAVSPSTAAPGDVVEVRGDHFAPDADVRFGAAASRDVTWVSEQLLRVVVPPGSGTVDVVVDDSAPVRFTYAGS